MLRWFGQKKKGIAKDTVGGRNTPALKVYCKKCKYFRRKLNDYYYMNREPNNPIPVECRHSSYEWHVECMHPDNHKEHVQYIERFDELKERRHKNVRSPRSINYSNDCHWFTKKTEDEPDWEK